jgi:hypothetical protein
MTNLEKYAYLYLANLEICAQITYFSSHVKIVLRMFEELESDPDSNPPESFKEAVWGILSVDMMRDISNTLRPLHESPWGQYAVTRAYCSATIFDLARDFDDGSLEAAILGPETDDWTDYGRTWALANTNAQFHPLYVKVDYIVYVGVERVKALILDYKNPCLHINLPYVVSL